MIRRKVEKELLDFVVEFLLPMKPGPMNDLFIIVETIVDQGALCSFQNFELSRVRQLERSNHELWIGKIRSSRLDISIEQVFEHVASPLKSVLDALFPPD